MPQQKVQAATDATLRSPSAVLRMPLGETRGGGDSVPIYATQSAVSQDPVLTGITGELESLRPRLVLVLATTHLTHYFWSVISAGITRARVVTRTADSILHHEADDPLCGVCSP